MQALIGLTIFSNGTFDDKIQTLYTAFDIDGSGSIDRRELSGFLSASIISMCKIVGLPQPSRIKIQEYTYEAFKIVDADGNGEIDPQEFNNWIKGSDQIQDFLLKYTGIQTFERAQRKYKQILDAWIQEFEDLSVEFCGDKYCEVKSLVARLHIVMKEIPVAAREKMFLLFSYEGNILISEDDFKIITASWAVFSATDVNNDNELDINELKTMLWLVEGKEPDASRVASAMYTMDSDG